MIKPKYVQLSDWNRHYNWPSVNQLRRLRFDEETNGFKGVTKKIGGRVVVNVQKLFDYVDNQ